MSNGARPTEPAAPRAPRFRFACQRSGRCCTHGEGRVWLEEGEAERLAATLDLSLEAFVERHARRVHDPARGRERWSLREERGRCVLLEGERHCSVYAARPEQCRTFPFWPAIEQDASAFEAARAVCPGIAVVVEDELAARAAERLDALLARYPVQDEACPFDDRGAAVWASGLEADRLLAQVEPAEDERAHCPFEHARSCGAGAFRPLACRVAHAAQDEQETALTALRALEAELGYPRAYGPLAGLVRSRRAPLDRSASSETAT